jgi:hypothetical protein
MPSELAQVEEQTPVGAVAKLPPELAIIKMENDSIMAMAAAHPRNHATVLADIKDQLATYKTFAQGAMYSKNVGKDERGRTKFARGLSIRAAEAIAAAYGYNRVRVEHIPIPDNPKAIKVEATFVDYQTGRIWQKASIVSKEYKARSGRIITHNDDRFYGVVCEAAASKLIRECILRTVPPGLRSELEAEVNAQLDRFLDDETVKKIVAQFSAKNVTVPMLEGVLGKKLDSLDKSDRAKLLGVWNAIEQEETTVAEVFNGGAEQKGPEVSNKDKLGVKGDNTKPATEPVPAPPPPEPEPAPTNADLTETKRNLHATWMELGKAEQEAVLFQFTVKKVEDLLDTGSVAELHDIKVAMADAKGTVPAKKKGGKGKQESLLPA